MGKGIWIGESNVARKTKAMYIGVNGVARKVKSVWIGVNNVARLCWSAFSERIALYNNGTQTASIGNLLMPYPEGICKLSDTHILLGNYERYNGSLGNIVVYNIYLNENGTISSCTKFVAESEFSDNRQAILQGITEVNNNYGVVFSKNYDNYDISGSCYATAKLFSLSSSNEVISSCTPNVLSNYFLEPFSINNNSVLLPSYTTTHSYDSYGSVYANTFDITSSSITNKDYNFLGNANVDICGIPVVAYLSENKIVTFIPGNNKIDVYIHSYETPNFIKQKYLSVTRTCHFSKYVKLDNNVFVLIGNENAIAFRIGSNNSIQYGNPISYSLVVSDVSRIGITDSIMMTTHNAIAKVLYCNTSNLSLELVCDFTPSSYGLFVPYKESSLFSIGSDGYGNLIFNVHDFS